jgi:hypothetical protein
MIDHYKKGTAIFTTTDDPDCEGVTAAREYIMMYEYTKEEIKLVRRDGVIQVITIKDIPWSDIRGKK